MNNEEFITKYIPALALALESSEEWKGPEDFIVDMNSKEMESFIDSNRRATELSVLLNFVDSYFDAKAHNFPDAIDGISFARATRILFQLVNELKGNISSSTAVNNFGNLIASLNSTWYKRNQ